MKFDQRSSFLLLFVLFLVSDLQKVLIECSQVQDPELLIDPHTFSKIIGGGLAQIFWDEIYVHEQTFKSSQNVSSQCSDSLQYLQEGYQNGQILPFECE